MKYIRQSLLFLLVGLGTAPFLVSCDQAPPQPNGQVEIPGEEAPQDLSGEAPADPSVPDSAISPDSDPAAQGEPSDPAAQGGPSDLPPLDLEQSAPDAVEPQGSLEEPQGSELPLITEPDPSAEEAPPVE
ncbi:hypothetical protein [Acaryochloris thomasi]|uniref:hypothetical protein n=1 Tax=Acaryochloris thomasi TaxID=2929456 RepID=UPI0011B3DEF9|nr:hypothetical protein [Acaryochloris thomasi]